jgi:hypothetical protein
LPECGGPARWSLRIDTNREAAASSTTFESGDAYETTAHSLLLFVLETAAA